MSKVLHVRAKGEAHIFCELLWHEFPEGWLDDLETNQFDLELWLMGFDVFAFEDNLTGFALLNEARRRAEKKYQNDFKQPHHDRATWAFFRFRLELALLKTTNADQRTLDHCYAYHDILATLAIRLGPVGRERPDWSFNDPSRETPF